MQTYHEAFRTLSERAIAFLPNVVMAIFLIAAGWLIGRLLAAAARHLMRRLRLDEVMEGAGWSEALGRAGVSVTPAALVGRLVFWSVLVVFLVLAIHSLGLALAALPLRAVVELLPRILGAVLLLLTGLAVAAMAGSAVGAALERIGSSQHRLLASGIRGLVLLVTFMAAIEHLGFDLSLLAGALENLITIFAAALAVTFALGGRGVARDMLAGYYARERFTAGDVLRMEEGEGKLTGIGTLTAVIETEEGSLVIPNRRLIESAVYRIDSR